MTIHEKVIHWFSNGEVGLSSKHMASVAGGAKGNGYHPLDPSDLNRCIKLVKAVPEIREHFAAIAATSKEWNTVISNWDVLVASFREECGEDWSKKRQAIRTYDKMKKLGL